jgi:tetratricopeptide (TPR) repeat protein
MNWRSVLWHEFVHVITLQKTNNRIPRWLSEGISVYEEVQRDPAWGQSLDPEFQPLLDANAWPGVESLEAYFVRPETPLHLMLGYFLAGEFVEAYVAAHGKPALVAALDAIATGTDAEEALLVAAGVDRAGLNAEFGAHLAIVCAPFAHLVPPPAPLKGLNFLATEKGALAEAMEAAALAQSTGNMDEAIVHLEKAAALYPDFPGEGNPLRQLARIQAERGDCAAWGEAVKRLQQQDPTAYAETKAYLFSASEIADWPTVLALSDWCFGVDPFDGEVHRARRSALMATGDRESLLKSLDALIAVDDARADDFRLEKAGVLLDLARRDEARSLLLALLENYPEFRAAQELLLRLHEETEELPDGDS